jgi:hypothetical protein
VPCLYGTSEYSAVYFFNRVCKLTSQGCYHVGSMSQHRQPVLASLLDNTASTRSSNMRAKLLQAPSKPASKEVCIQGPEEQQLCSTWGLPFSHALLQLMPHPNSGLLPVSISLIAILITSLHTHGVWALAAVARWVPAYFHKFLDWNRKSRLCLSTWLVPRICVIHTY